MELEEETISYIIGLPIALLIAFIVVYGLSRGFGSLYFKAQDKFKSEVIKLILIAIFPWVVAHFLSEVIGQALDYEGVTYIVVSFFTSSIIYICPVLVAIWLVWRVLPFSVRTSTDLDSKQESKLIEDVVYKILNSHQLTSSLRTALPDGKDDKEHGLDFIPFLLHRIDEKRKEYQKSSNRFLMSVIIFGLLFISTTTYFGYILINTSSSGIYKTTIDLESEIRKLNLNINITNKSLLDYIDDSKVDLEEFLYFIDDKPSLSRLYKEYEVSVSENNDKKSLKQISTIAVELESIAKKDYPKDTSKESFIRKLSLLSDVLKGYVPSLKSSERAIQDVLISSKAAAATIDNKINEPQFLRDDLIKRLSISLIVSTFFIAILRYLAGLYKSHHAELLKTEEEDMFVRKFYVAYKGSSSEDQSKDKVIETFLSKEYGNSTLNSSSKLGNEEVGIIGDLLKSLGKKI